MASKYPGGLLDGIRILSIAEQFPGPYATLLLADLGADVVMLERPDGGDPTRRFPGFFESLNRQKRSVALNLKAPAGREAALRLAETSDVLLEGFRPGTAERLGLSYAATSAINPRLVYVSISGFGQDGPARDRPAHDLSYQAMAGMLHERTSLADPGPPPRTPTADIAAAMFAAHAVVVGLLAVERTGTGSYVDVSMTDCVVSLMTTQLVPVMNGTGPPGVPPEPGYGFFRTSDSVTLSLSVAYEDKFWRALCHATELQSLADLTSEERNARAHELRGRLTDRILTHPASHWEKQFLAHKVPHARVRDLPEVAMEPQIKHRKMFVDVTTANGKPRRTHVRQPLRINGTSPGPHRHAPALGEDTAAILAELGYSAADIDRMAEPEARPQQK